MQDDVHPWPMEANGNKGPSGSTYMVKTLAGKLIPVWKGAKGEYWCHGLTLGDSQFSVWGAQVVQVLTDAGYNPVTDTLKAGDIAVWTKLNEQNQQLEVTHSAIAKHVAKNADGTLNVNATTFDSKNGQLPKDVLTLEQLRKDYGNPAAAFRK